MVLTASSMSYKTFEAVILFAISFLFSSRFFTTTSSFKLTSIFLSSMIGYFGETELSTAGAILENESSLLIMTGGPLLSSLFNRFPTRLLISSCSA